MYFEGERRRPRTESAVVAQQLSERYFEGKLVYRTKNTRQNVQIHQTERNGQFHSELHRRSRIFHRDQCAIERAKIQKRRKRHVHAGPPVPGDPEGHCPEREPEPERAGRAAARSRHVDDAEKVSRQAHDSRWKTQRNRWTRTPRPRWQSGDRSSGRNRDVGSRGDEDDDVADDSYIYARQERTVETGAVRDAREKRDVRGPSRRDDPGRGEQYPVEVVFECRPRTGRVFIGGPRRRKSAERAANGRGRRFDKKRVFR